MRGTHPTTIEKQKYIDTNVNANSISSNRQILMQVNVYQITIIQQIIDLGHDGFGLQLYVRNCSLM